jgi:hypothetical protein
VSVRGPSRATLVFVCANAIACGTLLAASDEHVGDDTDASSTQGADATGDVATGTGDGGATVQVDPGAIADASKADAGEAGFPAGSTIFAGTGHAYLVVVTSAGITWTAAKAEAEALGGHLVTITSDAENDFVHALAESVSGAWKFQNPNHFGPWVGAFQPAGSTEPNGGWRWVTAEPFFSKWHNGEPNDDGPEHFGHYYGYPNRTKLWADGPDTTRIVSYVVEFE